MSSSAESRGRRLRERYDSGWHQGRHWAEEDLRNGNTTADPRKSFAEVTHSDEARAQMLGILRGYRDTVARFDAGELTWQMFDSAPLGGRDAVR